MLSLLGEGWEASLLGGTAWESRSLAGLLSLLGTTRKEAQRDSVLPLSGSAQQFHLSWGRILSRGREATGMGVLGKLEDFELNGRAGQNLRHLSPERANCCIFPGTSILGA